MRVDAGTRVLVTGASKGIGAALARAFAERGATLGLLLAPSPMPGRCPGRATWLWPPT